MRLKSLCCIIAALLMLLGASACLKHPSIQTNKAPNCDEYMSVTINCEVSYSETDDHSAYRVSVYVCDLQNAEISEVFSFPQNSGYALGVYDRKSNSVYYTKEKNNNTYERQRTGDQIYMYNMSTGSDTMLTEDQLAVNHIIPVDDAVFFVGAKQSNADVLILGKINLNDGIVKYWNESNTLSIETISIDRIKKRIYVAAYDSIERDIAVELFNSNTSPHPVAFDNYIYSYNYDLGDRQEIISKKDMRVFSVYARNSLLLYGAHDSTVLVSEASILSEVIDVDCNDVLFQSDEYFSWRGGGFSQDLKGVYSAVNDYEFTGIEYFDFETRERKALIPVDSGYLANMLLMY